VSESAGRGSPGRAALVGVAITAWAAFFVLAAAFWIASNAEGHHGPTPDWARVVGDIGGVKVLPVLLLALAAALLTAGRWAEARFLLLAVTGAGVLMYAARIVLQVFGADDDGGRLSDYPSGHTAATTALLGAVTVLVWTAWRNARVRMLFAGVAAAGIVAMAWARVAAGEHTVLDVAGGIALGVGWLAVCLLLVPPTETRRLNRVHAVYALLGTGLAGFALLAVGYDHDPLTMVDQEVAEWVAASMPSWAESLARPFSWLGGWIGLTPISVGLVLLLLVTRRLVDAAWLALTFAGIQIVTALLKEVFDRPRPHEGSAVPLPSSDSFPSGHASGAVVTFGVLEALGGARWPERARMFWCAAAVLAIAVGASRVALNVHYLTDVLAGFSLGLAWLAVCLLVRDVLR